LAEASRRSLIAMRRYASAMASKSEPEMSETEKYILEKMLIVPRFLKPVAAAAPTPAKLFADFYASIFGDGNLKRKHKELMFTAIGIATASPRCLIHVIPAIKAGATDGEVFEACAVGFIAAGFYPNNPGIPYAFEYAAKTLDIAGKFRKGEAWEYLLPPEFRG
jgi:alkylhydroperoxidase/carboxymuconolactone decarboxylase family protein YurZ